MAKTVEEKLAPSDFVRTVLLELVERGKTEFPIDRVKWHRAFYDAIQEYGDKLPEFDVLKRINPYVHDIEKSFHWFMMSGHLSSIIPANTYRVEKVDKWKEEEKIFSMAQKGLLNEVASYICDRI